MLRVAIASVLLLGVMHLFQQQAARALIPVFRTVISLLGDRFVIEDVRIARQGASDTVRFRANLARPITVDGRTVYPVGWNGAEGGGFQVTYAVSGVLSYVALLLVVVLAWPARAVSEYALRFLLSIPAAAVLLVLDVPTTVLAELWDQVFDWADISRLSGWMIWSRFLMGGGGYLLALLMAAGVLISVRRLSMPRDHEVMKTPHSDPRFRRRPFSRP